MLHRQTRKTLAVPLPSDLIVDEDGFSRVLVQHGLNTTEPSYLALARFPRLNITVFDDDTAGVKFDRTTLTVGVDYAGDPT